MADKALTGVVSVDLSREPAPLPNAATIAETIKNFHVASEEDYASASRMIMVANSNIAKVEAFFEGTPQEPGIKVLAHRAHEAICKKIRDITAPWKAVRPTLEPRMKAYRAEQERLRRAEELRLQREAAEAQRRAQEEASRLQRAADQRAAELRAAGEMRAAKDAQIEAARKAVEGLETARILAEVGTVLPSVAPVGGPGEARVWGGVVKDILATCRAVGAKEIAPEYELPKRGGGTEMVPLVVVNQRVIDYLAKRHGREDIGVPGCAGNRGLSLRFSAKDAAPVQTGADEEEW